MQLISILMRGQRPLSALAYRLVAMRFLLYVGIQASYFIGVLGTLTYRMEAGAGDTAVAVAFLNAFIILGAFAGGTLLDAMGPRRHFVITVAGMVAAATFLLVADESMGSIIFGAAALGLMIGVSDVIARSYPAHLTADATELKDINSAISASSNIGVVLGPLVGGAIASVAPTKTVFLFLIACSAASLVPARGFRPSRRDAVAEPTAGVADECAMGAVNSRVAGVAVKPAADSRASAKLATGATGTDAQETRPGGSSLRAGARAVRSSAQLTLLFWVGFLCFMGYGAFDPLESLFYRDVLHVGVSWMGWLSAAAGIGAVAGALVAMRLPGRLVSVRTLLVIQLLEGLGCLLYVGTPWVGVALAGQLVLGVAFGAFTPLQNTLVQHASPLETVGRVSSIMNFGFNVAGVLPLLAAPWLVGVLGVQGALIAASLVVAVVPCVLMLTTRKRA